MSSVLPQASGVWTRKRKERKATKTTQLSKPKQFFLLSSLCRFPDAIPWYADKPKVQLALANSSLEYTLFFTGLFLDFLASDRQYLPSYPMPVNISALTADIPGTGDEPISLTKASDVAKYVVAAISDEAEWPEVSGIEGVRTTWNKVLKAAEEATGTFFRLSVCYLSRDTHQHNQCSSISVMFGT